jgi:hypothetical protein
VREERGGAELERPWTCFQAAAARSAVSAVNDILWRPSGRGASSPASRARRRAAAVRRPRGCGGARTEWRLITATHNLLKLDGAAAAASEPVQAAVKLHLGEDRLDHRLALAIKRRAMLGGSTRRMKS